MNTLVVVTSLIRTKQLKCIFVENNALRIKIDPVATRDFPRPTLSYYNLFEPRHDKTSKMSVRPAKTQISLGIRPVCSGSSLSA